MEYRLSENSYYYNKDGTKDLFIDSLSNCFEQNLYIIMKNKLLYDANYFNIFLEDLTFSISFDKNYNLVRSGIKPNNTGIDNSMIKTHEIIVRNNGVKAISMLESFLEKDKIVLVRTVDQLLPFTIYYNQYFDADNYPETGHLFLIVGQDRENFYYVDHDTGIEKGNFIPHPIRKDIGVFPKNDFLKALNIFMKCISINIREENIVNTYETAFLKLKKSASNYYANKFSKNDITKKCNRTMGGRRAVLELLAFFKTKDRNLKDKVFNVTNGQYSPFDLFYNLSTAITGIENRRKIFLGYLLKAPEYCNSFGLINQSELDLNAWGDFKNILTKRYFQNEFLIDGSIEKYLTNILDCEDKLFELLLNLIDTNYKPSKRKNYISNNWRYKFM